MVFKPAGVVGEVFQYLSYIGMCSRIGYGFLSSRPINRRMWRNYPGIQLVRALWTQKETRMGNVSSRAHAVHRTAKQVISSCAMYEWLRNEQNWKNARAERAKRFFFKYANLWPSCHRPHEFLLINYQHFKGWGTAETYNLHRVFTRKGLNF